MNFSLHFGVQFRVFKVSHCTDLWQQGVILSCDSVYSASPMMTGNLYLLTRFHQDNSKKQKRFVCKQQAYWYLRAVCHFCLTVSFVLLSFYGQL